jgi:hypothetical protein
VAVDDPERKAVRGRAVGVLERPLTQIAERRDLSAKLKEAEDAAFLLDLLLTAAMKMNPKTRLPLER